MNVDLPQVMRCAMARQAEAELEWGAKVINAEGEPQAANRLAQTARVIGDRPRPMQLHFFMS